MSNGLTEIQRLHAQVMKERAAILQSLKNEKEREQKGEELASLQKLIDKEYFIRKEINAELQKYPSLSPFAHNKNHRSRKVKGTLRKREHRELKGLGIQVPSMAVGKPIRLLGKNKNKKDRRSTRRRR